MNTEQTTKYDIKSLLMNSTTIIIISMIVTIATIFSTLSISYSNAEIRLRHRFESQQRVNESRFDVMWKVIKQKANIAGSERQSLQNAYSQIMKSQIGIAGNAQFASFMKQANIDITSDLYKELMTTIEAQRESFHRDQMTLLQLKNQHDNMLDQFPSSLIIGGRDRLKATIITSDKTEETFTTGKDNDTKLFDE